MTRLAALTGATGFLGQAVAARLVAEGWRVRGLVRASSREDAVGALQALGVERVVGDVTDRDSLTPLVEGADLVVHGAAVIAYRRKALASMRRVNVGGTRELLAACRAASTGRLVHVSSIAAVGLSDVPVELDEEAVWNAAPLRMGYFDTKHAAEQLVLSACADGLDAVIVNPGAIYGPSASASNSNQVVARVAAGRLRVAPVGGMNVVPLSTVVDGVVAAAAVGRAGRRYVLGGENLHFDELFVRIAAAAGRRLSPWRLPVALGPWLRAAMDLADPLVPAGAWYTPDLCAAFGRWMWFDTTRMRVELGVQPADLDACLAATLAQLSGAAGARPAGG